MAKRQAKPEPVEDTIPTIVPEITEEVPESVTVLVEGEAALPVASDIPEATIAEIETKYSKFIVLPDGSNITEAKSVLRGLVRLRNMIDKRRIAINKTFTDYVNGKSKGYIARLAVPEDNLRTQVEAYEKQAEIARQKRIEHVKTSLVEAGFQFDGVTYVCGTARIFEIELAEMTDETLSQRCAFAIDFRQNEATAAAEAARRAAPVYLHHPESNELLQMTTEEYELDRENMAASGVVEITKERYDEIKQAKLSAFRRPAPAATPTPEPTPAPVDERSSYPEHHANFMEKPAQPKPNEAFLGAPSFGGPSAAPAEALPIRETPEASAPKGWEALDAHSTAFDEGYERFRAQVVAAFENPNIVRKRSEWVEWFKIVKPTDRV